MRKTLAILLFLSITAPILGCYCWLSYQKQQVRKTVKRQLVQSVDKSQLVRLSFTKTYAETGLRWEHSKEFEWRGEMYDVVTTEANRDSVTYWCWWDKEETTLNKQLTNLVSNSLGKNKERRRNQEQLVDLLKTAYLPTTHTLFSRHPLLADVRHIEQKSCLSAVSLSPPFPPPWMVSC